MTTPTTSRRALLRAASTAIAYSAGAAIVGGGMALATNAKGETFARNTPFRIAEARYRAAEKHLNNLPSGYEADHPEAYAREERAYLDAVTAVDAAPVADWQEFADQVEIMFDRGLSQPGEKALDALYANVRRLSGRA